MVDQAGLWVDQHFGRWIGQQADMVDMGQQADQLMVLPVVNGLANWWARAMGE